DIDFPKTALQQTLRNCRVEAGEFCGIAGEGKFRPIIDVDQLATRSGIDCLEEFVMQDELTNSAV
ncbi:MAG: hypothetical protein HQ518_06695, partial [Rhodopirellula sp.]|nr:hypothetical protein [Rhodopirellula sp.]